MTEPDVELPLFAFSTLACPDWDAGTVVEQAAAFGYDAIEWRGGPDGHVRVDDPPDARAELRMMVEDAGLRSLAVTAYTDYVSSDPKVRRDSIDHLDRHLALAADLGAPVVRAFLGIVDEDAEPASVLGRAVDGLGASIETARDLGVAIAIEPHDDFARAASIAPVLDALDPAVVGAVWDIVNAWGADEEPADGVVAIRDRIRYVQVKDARWRDGEWQLTPIGEGDVPLAAAFAKLVASGRLPPLSVEWERAWHPELDPPSTALPRALEALRGLVQAAMRDTTARDGDLA